MKRQALSSVLDLSVKSVEPMSSDERTTALRSFHEDLMDDAESSIVAPRRCCYQHRNGENGYDRQGTKDLAHVLLHLWEVRHSEARVVYGSPMDVTSPAGPWRGGTLPGVRQFLIAAFVSIAVPPRCTRRRTIFRWSRHRRRGEIRMRRTSAGRWTLACTRYGCLSGVN